MEQIDLLYVAADYWMALAYATNPGGETHKLALQEADEFDAVCTSEEAIDRKLRRFRNALHAQPGHAATIQAVRLLEDRPALEELRIRVSRARARLADSCPTGHPVVIAIRVDVEWVEGNWTPGEEDGGFDAVNLSLHTDAIESQRILAQAAYPNGSHCERYMSLPRPSWLKAQCADPWA